MWICITLHCVCANAESFICHWEVEIVEVFGNVKAQVPPSSSPLLHFLYLGVVLDQDMFGNSPCHKVQRQQGKFSKDVLYQSQGFSV